MYTSAGIGYVVNEIDRPYTKRAYTTTKYCYEEPCCVPHESKIQTLIFNLEALRASLASR